MPAKQIVTTLAVLILPLILTAPLAYMPEAVLSSVMFLIGAAPALPVIARLRRFRLSRPRF